MVGNSEINDKAKQQTTRVVRPSASIANDSYDVAAADFFRVRIRPFFAPAASAAFFAAHRAR